MELSDTTIKRIFVGGGGGTASGVCAYMYVHELGNVVV